MQNKNSTDFDMDTMPDSASKGSAERFSSSLFFRVFKFPLRAILGLEPVWKVIVAGGVLLFSVFKMVTATGGYFLQKYPIPEYALQVTYVSMAVFVLTQIWFLVALWQAAGRLKMLFANVVIKIIVALAVMALAPGDWNVVHVLQTSLSSSPKSIFERGSQ